MQGADKHSVLLVDDDNMIRNYLSLILRNEGFKIAGEVGDIAKAKQQLKRSKVTLVLLDINLLEDNGLTALPELRQEYPDICFMMISGDSTVSNVTTALKDGAKGFVTKPFTIDSVIQAVGRALQLGE